MKLFYKEFISFLLVCSLSILIVAAISRLSAYPSNNYMFTYRNKHDLALNTKEKKILLLGGSSLAFGINSEKLSTELGAAVVNMGYHAGQGIDYRLNEALTFIRKGDTVILSVEYAPLNGNIDPKVIWNTFEANPRCIQYFGLPTFKVFFDEAILFGLNTSFNRLANKFQGISINRGIYVLDSFNKFGDFTAHYDSVFEREPFVSNMCIFRPNEIKVTVSKLRRFQNTCKEIGANVYMIMPRIPEPSFELSKDGISKTRDTIINMANIEVLNQIEEIPLDDKYFYDTNYHLTGSGVVINTQDFCNWIEPILNSDSN